MNPRLRIYSNIFVGHILLKFKVPYILAKSRFSIGKVLNNDIRLRTCRLVNISYFTSELFSKCRYGIYNKK